MNKIHLTNRLSTLLFCLLVAGKLAAQNPITWDATPASCSWSPNFNGNNITNGPNYEGPSSFCGAASKNVLSTCRASGYVSAQLQASYLSNPLALDEIVLLGLDDTNSVFFPNKIDYAITLTAKSTGTYTLTIGQDYDLLSFTSVLYSATITPVAGDVYRIFRIGSSIKFCRNADTLAATTWNGKKLRAVALLQPHKLGRILDINTDFGVPDGCGNSTDDNDWKGAGTGTLAPFNNNDNVYVPAKIGIGVPNPVEKLEVGGRVKINTIDSDNIQTRILVTDGGLIKYRNMSTLTPWLTTGGGIPASLNDDIYRGGRVGIGTSSLVEKLTVATSAINDGIRVTQTGSGYAGIKLENLTTGGKSWGLLSLGALNSQGPGGFLIFNYTAGVSTMFIDGTTQNVGIGTTLPGIYRLSVNGTVYASGGFVVSDRRFKKDIVPIQDAMKLISALDGVRYAYRDDIYYPQSNGNTDKPVKRNFPQGTQLGLIAQDVEKILPEVVNTDNDGYKAIAYQNIVALLIEGMKEQEKRIEVMEQRLTAVESGHLPSNPATGAFNVAAVNNGSWLGQSVPNPTSNSARITYHLDGNVTKAIIVLYTIDGTEVRRFSLIPGKNDGEITVNSTELQNGIYIYSLITGDGIADTKKMMITR